MSSERTVLAREPLPETTREAQESAAQTSAVTRSAAGEPHHIVIIGGGAGGLVLATRLGNSLGRRGQARITLVDAALTHVWKPLLHEIAAGTLRTEIDSTDYLAQARTHHFTFALGRMTGLDRKRREVVLDPITDLGGKELVPGRRLAYDTLVLAVGSALNDFGVPGVSEHALYLETHAEAERIRQRIFNLLLRNHTSGEAPERRPLRFAIVGAGATGVEFAAELCHATHQMATYGLSGIDPHKDIRITLIEAAPRVLPALPERLQEATERELRQLGIEVRTGEQVAEVTADAVRTSAGEVLPADLVVWAAGVKGPSFLASLDGLEANRLNQLVVDQSLRTTRDPNIFAFGDCAACPQPGSERPVPPRAQAAHQQAYLLAKSFAGRLKGKEPLPFVYKDYGSLISLSNSTVGNLMGNLFKSITIEGRLARLAYLSLYRKHQLALHGLPWVILTALSDLVQRRIRPHLKLH
jgi:NADH:ubiquinone reductase (H+-translocating)